MLEAARNKSKQQLEVLKAALCPQPDVPTMLRKLPGPSAEEAEPLNGLFTSAGGAAVATVEAEHRSPHEDASPLTRAALTPLSIRPTVPARKMAPLSPERYKLQLTLDEETYQALRQLQDLLRHQVPNGDLVQIVKGAVLERLERVQREKFGQTKRPAKRSGQTTFVSNEWPHSNPGSEVDSRADSGSADEPAPRANSQMNSRHFPAGVKRAVWDRDQGQCAFVSRSGRRCVERGRLEFHHLYAYALGGPATIENIALRCRAHNAHESAGLFGGKGKKLTGAGASCETRPGEPRPGGARPGTGANARKAASADRAT